MSEEPDHEADKTDAPGRSGECVGHYEIIGPLGRGGMAIVYRARDLRLDRLVALKRPAPGHEADPTFQKRFLREARAASKVSHPNIVPVYEVFEHEGTPWLAMPLIRGQTLRERVKAQGRLPVAEILRFGQQLSEAVQAAHDEHILHRDINPNNILISERGEALLADFGLARYFEPPEDSGAATTRSCDITEVGAVVGTPGYMSPEQCLARTLDRRCDLFSLGAVLYEMCTGSPAFAGASRGELYDKILHQEPQPISTLNYAVPAELERIVRKALAKDLDERYQDARDMVVDLRALKRHLEFESYGREHHTPTAGAETGLGAHRSRGGRSAKRIGVVLVVVVVVVPVLAFVSSIVRDRMQRLETSVQHLLITPLRGQAGQEFVARISPDGQWVAHSAKVGGSYALSVQRMVGGACLPVLTDKKRITGHVWSPDGSEIAVQLLIGDESFLQTVAAFEGTVSRSVKLAPLFLHGVPQRWIGGHIYVDVPLDGLWRVNLDTESFDKLQESDVATGMRSHFDVCGHEDKTSFTVRQGERLTIWVADMSGEHAEMITPIGSSDFNGRWCGADCRSLAFSALENGQMDLWRMSIATGARERLTFSNEYDYVQDVSRDGKTLVMVEQQETAQLWLVDPRAAEPHARQVTAENALHLWPTASQLSRAVVFERSKPVPGRMLPLFDSEIVVAELEADALRNARRMGMDGGYASLSPNGSRLAYVRQTDNGLELWLQDMGSVHAWRVSDCFPFPTFTIFPVDWIDREFAWTPNGDGLFFVKETPDGQQIWRVPSETASQESQLIASCSEPNRVSALHVCRESGALVYVRSQPATGRSELRYRDSSTPMEKVLHSFGNAPGDRLYLLGSLAGCDLVALECLFNTDLTDAVEVIKVDTFGSRMSLGKFDHAFGATARLDEGQATMFITRAEGADNPHNVYAFDLSQGSLRRLTNNTNTNTSFSGLEPTPGERLLFTEHQKSDSAMIIRLQ